MLHSDGSDVQIVGEQAFERRNTKKVRLLQCSHSLSSSLMNSLFLCLLVGQKKRSLQMVGTYVYPDKTKLKETKSKEIQ